MFLTDRRFLLPTLLVSLIFMALMTGCGLRQSQTGSLSGRVVDADGNAVVNAQIYSLFAEKEKVLSGLDGGFYLSELPAGLNNIVILHDDFQTETHQIEIKSDDTTVVDLIKLDQAGKTSRISNVRVVGVASTSAVVAWQTLRSVACNVDYGTSVYYGSLLREQRPATEHTAVLSGLLPETLYHFRVQYLDESAASYFSYDYSFRTADADRPQKPAAIRILPFTSPSIVELEWDAATSGLPASGFIIYRQLKNGVWTRLNETPVDEAARAYADQAAVSGGFCRYAVAAVNSLGAESELTVSEMVLVPGVIASHMVIETTDSPVRLNSDLIVAAGTSLTIQAGTEIQIGDSDSLQTGSDEEKIEIIVQGRLEIQGTAEAPVVFSPMNGSGKRDHWAGIRILSSLGGVSDLNHVKLFGCKGYALEVNAESVRISNISVAYSNFGLLLDGVREVMSLDNCSFSEIASVALDIRNCRRMIVDNSLFSTVHTGISVKTLKTDDQTIIRNTDIYASNTGIKGLFGRSRILNTLVVCPEGAGIVCENTLSTFDNYIDHVTVDALNGIAIYNGVFNIQNSIVANHNQKGLVGISCGTGLIPEYTYNDVFGFSTAYQGCSGGTGSIAIDPKFAAGNPYDYSLMADSTLKLQDSYGSEIGRYGVSRL